MINKDRKKEAQKNFAQYLQDGLIKKEKNETAKAMYLKNAGLIKNILFMNHERKVYKL